MRKITDAASFLFILSLVVLGTISILGIWELFDEEVIVKAFQTIGLLAAVSVVISIAGRALDKSTLPEGASPIIDPSFKIIRHITLGSLIISAAILAFLGVLAIWEVVAGDVMARSLASLATISFLSLVIVMVCLEREHNPSQNSPSKKWSLGSIILVLFLGYLAINLFGSLLLAF